MRVPEILAASVPEILAVTRNGGLHELLPDQGVPAARAGRVPRRLSGRLA